jgi:hypothetical protein
MVCASIQYQYQNMWENKIKKFTQSYDCFCALSLKKINVKQYMKQKNKDEKYYAENKNRWVGKNAALLAKIHLAPNFENWRATKNRTVFFLFFRAFIKVSSFILKFLTQTLFMSTFPIFSTSHPKSLFC